MHTINVLSVDSTNESSISVINEQEVLGKSFKVYGTFENPLFLAKDVAEWIDYSKTSEGYFNVSKMLMTVDEDEKITITNSNSEGKSYKQSFLTEDGLYEVLMQSRKPIAKQFKKEVKKILHELRTKGSVSIHKSEEDISLKEKELNILEKQIATERAKLWREIGLDASTQSKTYKQICDAYATKELEGTFVLPLSATRKTYSAEEVGKQLGISANKVGKIANHYGLKVETLGCWQKDKSKYDSTKEVDAWRYYDEAIPLIEEHKEEKFPNPKKVVNQKETDLFDD